MSEAINNMATAASEEEKKKWYEELKELIKAIFKKIDWHLTHTGKGALVEQMKQMQEQIEESIAQNEINSDTIEELCEVFKELNGSLDTLTPDKFDEIMVDTKERIEKILESDFIGVNKEAVLSKEIDNFLGKKGIELGENFEDRIRIIDNDKTDNKLYVEVDGHLMEAVYDKEAKKVRVDASSKKYEEVFKADGSLQDGFEYVEAKTGNAEHDMMFSFAEKNDMKYAFDKEQTMKDIEAQLSPKGLWLQSRMSSVKLSEGGRYESHYFASEKAFRIRDTQTKEMLEIKVDKNKIEIFASKNAKNVEDMRSPQRVGQFNDDGKGIQGRFTFSSPNIAMMFHCEEMKQVLEYNGVSRENQKELLRQDNDIQWSKVQDAHRNKVYELKDACVERAEKARGEFSVRVSKKTDKFTFLTITKQEGKENNPTISISFDEQGNPKTLNCRTDDGKFAFMQNLRSHNVSENMYKLRSDPSFSQVYNIVTDVLKDMGIDAKCRSTKPMKAPAKSTPAPTKNIPFNERGINGREEQYGSEKMFADMANKVAMHALSTGGKIDRHTVHNLGIRNDADTILKELAKMHVLKKVGTRYERATTAEIYANKIIELAKSPDNRKAFIVDGHNESFTAFLIDSYQKYRENEKVALLQDLSSKESKDITKLLEKINVDKPTDISTSYIQGVLSCEYNEAYELNGMLRKLGVIENGVVAVDEKRISEMLDIVKVQEEQELPVAETENVLKDIPDVALDMVADYLDGMHSFPVDNIPSIVAELEEKGIENAESLVTLVRDYMIAENVIDKADGVINNEKYPEGTFTKDTLAELKNSTNEEQKRETKHKREEIELS